VSYLDAKYIGLISVRLEKFKKVREGLYNFRCPYCGDSSRNKNKTRGYIYRTKADYNFKCHNCGMSRSFTYFLKDRDPSLYDEYVMERYKEGISGKGTVTPEPNFIFDKPKFRDKDICDELTKISELNTTHPAKRYLVDRGIPEEHLKRLYFCPNFKEWTNNHKKIFRDINNDDERIIIPLRDSDGNLFGYQGRSLDPNNQMRYITIMLEDNPKIFGLDRVDKRKNVYVTEGPFDSMFIDNSIAMCGSDVILDRIQFPDCVFVFDNEPRNKQIVERIDKTIRQNDKVVIWPSDIKEKDINDMVMHGLDAQKVVECNTYQGLEAKLKLNYWKKV